MIIAQITDLHLMSRGGRLDGVVDTAECLRRCIECLNLLTPCPDILLLTGDLVDAGTEAEYLYLREHLKAIRQPVFIIPGNHDSREQMLRVFSDQPYLTPGLDRIPYQVDVQQLRLIALDTVVPGEAGGSLDASSLSWLEQTLSDAPRRPTLIFMHHPPFRTGIAYMDAIGLEPKAAQELGAIVERHSQIEKIVCGHLHRAIETRWHGASVTVCPSCAHQVDLRLGGDPVGAFTLEPPAFQLHCWDGERIVTHTRCVGDFPGPFQFGSGALLRTPMGRNPVEQR